MEKISVLMSVYNEKDEWLSMAIESILNQTYTNIEFIIVNDNPTDERICRILSDYEKHDSRIHIVTNERNMGLVASLNNGLKYVTGGYTARMDADDYSHPDRLEKQLHYLTSGGFDLVSSYYNGIDENGNITIYGEAHHYSAETIRKLMRYSNALQHSPWLLKTSLYKDLSGYRNVHAAEDYDFLLRAMEGGYSLGIADDVLFDVRYSSKSISAKNKLRQFITLYYLAERINNVCELDCNNIEKYVSSRVTEKHADAYVKATEYIRIASKASKLKMLFYVFRALLTSRYAWKYMQHVIKLRRIKRKGKR